MSPNRFILPLLAAAVVIGCVTINVYFPEEKVKDLSERIEEEVVRQAAATSDGGAEVPPNDGAGLEPLQRLWSGTARLVLRLTASPVTAQQGRDRVPPPEVTNPAIRAIIDSRATRLDELNRFKARKVVGENNQGLVEVRELGALELRERAELQRLVKAENDDREALYREIAAATNVDLAQLPQIRSTYAKTLRENAKPGDLIQQPDGRWVEKQG